MSVSVCPIATVEASAERVWELLADPNSYGLWWDAETCAIEPAGAAQAGQRILARTRAFGRDWDVRVTVKSVDAEKRTLELTTQLPLGTTVHNRIVCGPVDEQHCRVSFG